MPGQAALPGLCHGASRPIVRAMTRAKSDFYGRKRVEPDPPPRTCDRDGCSAPGEHRAPKGRDQPGENWWFCLEHVRAYNKSFNYFEGMPADEIEAYLRGDIHGHRPTWPLGSLHARRRFRFEADGETMDDPFDLFEAERRARARQRQSANQRARSGTRKGRRNLTPVEQAMKTLDLTPPLSLTTLKIRYKELVKKFHPDANGGDTAAEDRLKEVNQAYNTLRAHLRT